MELNWTDAWLMHSIYLSSKKKPSTFNLINETADFLNRTKFSKSEFDEIIEKLLVINSINVKSNQYSASDKFIEAYKQNKHRFETEFENISITLEILRNIDKTN